MPYTVFRKVFIKEYHIFQRMQKLSVFRHQFIAFHCYGRTSPMNGFNESTAAGTRLQYRIIFMYSSGKHNQPVGNIGRSFKKLVILL